MRIIIISSLGLLFSFLPSFGFAQDGEPASGSEPELLQGNESGAQRESQEGAESEDAAPARGEKRQRAYVIAAGLFVGQRSFEASAAESTYNVDSSAPLTGGALRLGVQIVELASGEIRVDGGGGYAPISVEFVADGGEPFKVTGHHVTGRAAVGYRHNFGGFYAGVALGADAVSSTLEPNSYFTGSRYISALAGVEAGVMELARFGLSVEAGVLPVLDQNISGDAYGEPQAIDIAYFGEVGVRYAITQDVALEIGYGARAFSSTFAEPSITSSTVKSTDFIHVGRLGASFGF